MGRLCRSVPRPPTEQQPAHCSDRDALAEPTIGYGRGQDRLQAGKSARRACRNRMRNRDRGAAEIEPCTRMPATHCGRGHTIGPFRRAIATDHRHQDDHQRHPDRGDRSGIGHCARPIWWRTKPVLHSTTKSRRRARQDIGIATSLRSVVPDHLLAARIDRAGRPPHTRQPQD